MTGPSRRTDPFADDLTSALHRLGDLPSRRLDVDADRDSVEHGLVQFVLTVVERLGSTLLLLGERMEELKEQFGLRDDDLNLDLGPLGPLLPRQL
jgi:hypothetical protein